MARTLPSAALLASALFFLIPSAAEPQVTLDSDVLAGLAPRSIGPAVMSGRIAAIAGVAAEPVTHYVGSGGGGVWKSDDGGTTFKPVFDQHPQSIGAIAVDPSNPNTVWVGTGEAWVRNSVSVGAGLYQSTDGGDHWTLVGLKDSERIAKVVVHPTQGDVVYVCVAGHLWNGHDERGVYQTTDGGKTWARCACSRPSTIRLPTRAPRGFDGSPDCATQSGAADARPARP